MAKSTEINFQVDPDFQKQLHQKTESRKKEEYTRKYIMDSGTGISYQGIRDGGSDVNDDGVKQHTWVHQFGYYSYMLGITEETERTGENNNKYTTQPWDFDEAERSYFEVTAADNPYLNSSNNLKEKFKGTTYDASNLLTKEDLRMKSFGSTGQDIIEQYDKYGSSLPDSYKEAKKRVNNHESEINWQTDIDGAALALGAASIATGGIPTTTIGFLSLAAGVGGLMTSIGKVAEYGDTKVQDGEKGGCPSFGGSVPHSDDVETLVVTYCKFEVEVPVDTSVTLYLNSRYGLIDNDPSSYDERKFIPDFPSNYFTKVNIPAIPEKQQEYVVQSPDVSKMNSIPDSNIVGVYGNKCKTGTEGFWDTT